MFLMLSGHTDHIRDGIRWELGSVQAGIKFPVKSLLVRGEQRGILSDVARIPSQTRKTVYVQVLN